MELQVSMAVRVCRFNNRMKPMFLNGTVKSGLRKAVALRVKYR